MKIGDNEHTFNFQMQTLAVFLYDDALCIEYIAGNYAEKAMPVNLYLYLFCTVTVHTQLHFIISWRIIVY